MNIYKLNKWKTTSEQFRAQNPLCLFCLVDGFVKASKEVDHIIPFELGGAIWNWLNFQALCARCHGLKTKADQTGLTVQGVSINGELIPIFYKFYEGGAVSSIIKQPTHDEPVPFSRTFLDFKKQIPKIHVFGNVSSGKTTVCNLLNEEGYPILNIDEYRRTINQSRSMSGEYHAWNIMYKDSLKLDAFVMESSGTAMKIARFERKHKNLFKIKVHTDPSIMMKRLEDRSPVPVPKKYGSIYKAVYFINKTLKDIDGDINIENSGTIKQLKTRLWQKLDLSIPA